MAKRTWLRRGRKLQKPEAQETLGRVCAWCKSTVPEDGSVFTVTARAREGVELSDLAQDGPFLVMSLYRTGPKVHGLVTTDHSEAKQLGADLVFMVCSEECGLALRQALAHVS